MLNLFSGKAHHQPTICTHSDLNRIVSFMQVNGERGEQIAGAKVKSFLAATKAKSRCSSNRAICILNGNALFVWSIWLRTGALMGLVEQFQLS